MSRGKKRLVVPPPAAAANRLPASYDRLLADIKSRIRSAQVKAALAANAELIRLYWSIGRDIVERQRAEGWGKAIVERLSHDIRREFPRIKGFSPQNLWYMRAFYLAWSEVAPILQRPVGELAAGEILQRPVGEIARTPARSVRKLRLREELPRLMADLPWGHNVILIEKVKDPAERIWYAQTALEHGWSRDILALQIETGLCRRRGRAVSNFARTLPAPQSDLAAQALKDPYVFDFLTLADDARERDIENQLLQHIARFLVELGAGFAFVGRQVHLGIGGDDFYLDLLFYHTRLHCYVVIDLKNRAFQAEDAGKMNLYLSAVDDRMRQPEDKPSLGLLLCKAHNRLVAEYALRDIHKPIGVAAWAAQLTRALPKALRSSLPTVEEIEVELARDLAQTARQASAVTVPTKKPKPHRSEGR